MFKKFDNPEEKDYDINSKGNYYAPYDNDYLSMYKPYL